ncbi:MAG: hypothetical protein HQL68_00290 [Magnetococcales bacterium]|nr:hypothetical protein [Magnetococcales bacterium]
MQSIYDPILEEIRKKDIALDLGTSFQGEYGAGVAYTTAQSVAFGGLLYVCIQDGTGQQPDTATGYWSEITNKGDAGPQGIQGIQGEPGSAAATSIAVDGLYFASDLDSGFVRSGADNIVIKTGATDALALDASQNATFSSNVIITGNLNGLDIQQNANNSLVIGTGAGSALAGDADNVIMGVGAADAATSLSKSVVIGKDAIGVGAYTGSGYVVIGHEAGNSLTSSLPGVLIGQGAGKSVSSRHNVVAIGADAAKNAICNSGNIYIGYNAGINSGGGANCIYLGNSVAAQNSGGLDNVVIGASAANATQNLSGSVVIGKGALQSGNGTSADNVIIGDGAGKNLSSGGGNVLLGHDAGAQLTTESNQLVVANSNTLTPLLAGDFTDKNIGINSTDYGSGAGVLALADVTTAPTSNPTGGGVIYFDAGVLKIRTSTGVYTVNVTAV